MNLLKDNYNRVHNYLRISLTDRCNLNCSYCNPVFMKSEYINIDDLLTYEDITRLIKIFAGHFEIKKIRFTGGEPLARKGFTDFIGRLDEYKKNFGFQTAITTNGVLLAEKLNELVINGIDSINISLDSLNPGVYEKITGKNELHNVLNSILKAKEISFTNVKINCVVMKGVNDQEILPFTEFAVKNNINVRFIEYMPFTNNGWNEDKFISASEIRKIIGQKYHLKAFPVNGSVSKDYSLNGYDAKVSFISSISDNFCSTCSRLRVTSKGNLRNCLFSEEHTELNLKDLLRFNLISDYEIASLISEFVKTKPIKRPGVNQLVKMNYNYMLRNGG
jgi:cyclic pyranopterin phosphate synthase